MEQPADRRIGGHPAAKTELGVPWRVIIEQGEYCKMPSTAIKSINYHPATRTLSVWFVPSGNRYDYEDVPPQIHASFRKAPSKGRFFNEQIRDRYKYHLVERSHSG
jgi:hypothetical protein